MGCEKPEDISVVPSIAFEKASYTPSSSNSDSLLLTFSYVDGDGDIGLGQQDTLPPFDSLYYYNLHINYFEKIEGQFRQVTRDVFSDDTIRYLYRIPPLLSPNQAKPIKGNITVRIGIQTVYSDTIKLSFYIYDRNLHQSNTITTPEIITGK